MEIRNIEQFGKCEICNVNPVIGKGFGNKWVCGLCLIKLEEKLKEQRAKFFEELTKEIRENA